MSLTASVRVDARIDSLEVRAYEIPTATPESDGTLQWDSTTLAYVEIRAAGEMGLGFAYADAATATLINTLLRDAIIGKDAAQIGARLDDMYATTRNLGCGGITSMAVSAVDVALWDLKAKLLGVPAYVWLGVSHTHVRSPAAVFTSYSEQQLCDQLAGWVNDGIPRVKMKVDRDANADPRAISHPVNTATGSTPSHACSTPARSMFFRPTPRIAAGSRGCPPSMVCLRA